MVKIKYKIYLLKLLSKARYMLDTGFIVMNLAKAPRN